MRFTLAPLVCLFVLTGCNSQSLSELVDPGNAGLIAVRPYPTDADICQVLGENFATQEYLDDNSLLIGCPDHETGAIADRRREGARPVGKVANWLLLSVPL